VGVPNLDATRLHDPHLAQIGARDVTLEIVDQREHGRDPEGKAVANVRDALTERLGRAGVVGHLLRVSLGADATPACESALNLTLDELARVAAQLVR
jgi:hypothetical protein